jgi:protein-disulfide isomerase
LTSLAALLVLSLPVLRAAAQQPAAAEPTPDKAVVLPTPNPANFTAATPSKEVVSAYIHANWGYDEDRVWQVWAILKTPVEGISKVEVLVGDKAGKQKLAEAQFYVLPDGKHLIAGGELIPFGEHPFAETRAVAQQRADGPYRGSASKDLEIIEFADFQCPHCKAAQANMEKLAVDFPQAHIVFQSYPLPQHPAAAHAAAYGACVAKLGGNDAFFTFASAVFEGQDGLATTDGATLTLNSAVTKAGLEPAKIAACAATSAVAAQVEAMGKLAKDLDINQTPILLINGRQVTATAPYETLKKIVQFQSKLDAVKQ